MNSTTEKNASQKVCPFRLTDHNSDQHCIGSRCMAWRWIEPERCNVQLYFAAHNEVIPKGGPQRPFHIPNSLEWFENDEGECGWIEPEENAALRRLGYCGRCENPNVNNLYSEVMPELRKMIGGAS